MGLQTVVTGPCGIFVCIFAIVFVVLGIVTNTLLMDLVEDYKRDSEEFRDFVEVAEQKSCVLLPSPATPQCQRKDKCAKYKSCGQKSRCCDEERTALFCSCEVSVQHPRGTSRALVDLGHTWDLNTDTAAWCRGEVYSKKPWPNIQRDKHKCHAEGSDSADFDHSGTFNIGSCLVTLEANSTVDCIVDLDSPQSDKKVWFGTKAGVTAQVEATDESIDLMNSFITVLGTIFIVIGICLVGCEFACLFDKFCRQRSVHPSPSDTETN